MRSENYLKYIKPTRLEGLIVECLLEKTLLTIFPKRGYKLIDSLIIKRLKNNGSQEFIVFDTKAARLLAPSLEKTGLPLRYGRISVGSNCVYLNDSEGNVIEVIKSGGKLKESTEKASLDEQRIKDTLGGFDALEAKFERFARDIIIKDCFLQPASRAIWDLDRFLVDKHGGLIYIESKHKFPIPSSRTFGMNIGEVELIKMLAKAHIDCFHVILVKPIWNKNISTIELFSKKETRDKFVWIVANAGLDGFFGIEANIAGAHTSIQGKNEVKYVNLNLEAFREIGPHGMSPDILSNRFFDMVDSIGFLDKVTYESLNSYRIDKPHVAVIDDYVEVDFYD